MKSSHWLFACAIAGHLVSVSVGAQTAPASTPGPSAGVVTLRAALDAAWQRSVSARESAGQRRRAEADRFAATSLWPAPPSIAVGHRSDRLQNNSGQQEIEVGVTVPIWLPGQRAASASTADAAVARSGAAEQVARLQLAGEVREAAWQLAAVQAEMAQTDNQAQALKQLVDDVERRVRAGDLARADGLVARAEQLAASSLQFDLRQRLQAASARWTLLTGQTTLPDVTAVASANAAPDTTDGTDEPHPELQLARISTELARKRVDQMRLSRRDAPEISVGLKRDISGRAEAAQDSMVIGLRLSLGTDVRNRPLEAAALAELDVALAAEQRLQDRLASNQAIARDTQQSAQAQFEAQTARARLLRERATLIEKSFRAGETPLPDLLRAQADAAQADSAVARQTAALGLARAHLQQTLGLLP